MEVKEAIAAAKEYIKQVYADEGVSQIGLEEVEYNPGDEHWMITVGFARPLNGPRTPAQEALEILGSPAARFKRSLKKLTISPSGHVVSMKDREMAD